MWSAATVLVCALGLLGRSPDTFPAITLLEAPPPGVSENVEAFVRTGDPTIYLITSSAAFLDARTSPHRCGDSVAIRKIASILVHEEWHVRHGPDERGAYQAQLMTLMRLGSGQGTPVFGQVSRSMRAVLAIRDPRREPGRAAPPAPRDAMTRGVRPR